MQHHSTHTSRRDDDVVALRGSAGLLTNRTDVVGNGHNLQRRNQHLEKSMPVSFRPGSQPHAPGGTALSQQCAESAAHLAHPPAQQEQLTAQESRVDILHLPGQDFVADDEQGSAAGQRVHLAGLRRASSSLGRRLQQQPSRTWDSPLACPSRPGPPSPGGCPPACMPAQRSHPLS